MIRFIKSPSGAYGLAYFVGDTATLSTKLEDELVEMGYAERCEPEKAIQQEIETPEKATKKRGK